MLTRTLVLPQRFDLRGLCRFLDGNDLELDDSLNYIQIDNAGHEWIEPVGLVALCAIVRHLRHQREAVCPVGFTDPQRIAYFQRMDLLREIGVRLPEPFLRWRSRGHFTELRSIARFAEAEAAAGHMVEIFPEAGDLRAFAHHCVSELLNNAFQHGQSEIPPVTCAQAWPTKQQGQIAVADCGVGIRATLQHYAPSDDLEAIDISLRPGTSGQLARAAHAEYGARGYGLYMIRSLAEAIGGQLVVVSYTGYLLAAPGRADRSAVRPWPGTLVGVQFPLALPDSWVALRRRVYRSIPPGR